MRIQNQPQLPYKYGYTPHFTSSTRDVTEGGKLLYSNFTNFYRNDIKDWNKYIDFLGDKFKDAPKVNSYCIAASKGDEVFSTVMLLMKRLGIDKAQKFFPFTAIDIDEEILKTAQSGKTYVSQADIDSIKRHLGEDDYKKYVNFDNVFKEIEGEKGTYCTAEFTPLVRNAVKFEKADAREFVNKIEPGNCFVMARNFWPYLPTHQDRLKLSENLGNKLQKNSICVLGDYDLIKNSVDSMLLDEGFDTCAVDYCYVKKELASKDYLSNPEYLMNTFANKK